MSILDQFPRRFPAPCPQRLPWRTAPQVTALQARRASCLPRAAALAGLAAPLALSAVLIPFRDSFPNTDAALALVLVVVAVAAAGRRLGGIVAAVSAAVWFDFFLTVPYERFTITRRADIETTALILAVGIAVTEIAAPRLSAGRATWTGSALPRALWPPAPSRSCSSIRSAVN
jgi:K+-sensing histidine kinase KdpD